MHLVLRSTLVEFSLFQIRRFIYRWIRLFFRYFRFGYLTTTSDRQFARCVLSFVMDGDVSRRRERNIYIYFFYNLLNLTCIQRDEFSFCTIIGLISLVELFQSHKYLKEIYDNDKSFAIREEIIKLWVYVSELNYRYYVIWLFIIYNLSDY